jgi:hypothetical protein
VAQEFIASVAGGRADGDALAESGVGAASRGGGEDSAGLTCIRRGGIPPAAAAGRGGASGAGAGGPEEASFAGSFAMLGFPGTQFEVEAGIGRATPLGEINSLRDNWWCQWTAQQENSREIVWRPPTGSPLEWVYPGGSGVAPAFLSEADKSQADQEWERFARLPAVPNYLGKIVLDWARQHPGDPRVPEALHLVVRASRYCFADKDTGSFSKAAFDLLHRRYPRNEWTKKTPYWFN